MINNVDKKICTGCDLCAAICPQKCIKMISNEEGFLYPVIDNDLCIECNLCEKYCHAINIHTDNTYLPKVFAAYTKNDIIRMKSSSGGIFYSLARYVISLGGSVYGAVFNSNNEVIHDRADALDQIDNMLGSKYVQSRIESDIYQQIRDDLENEKYVLFSGTPCQCGAVKHYTSGLKTNNLYIISFICHGVPSPLVWREYINWQTKVNGANVVKASFRDKTLGWTRFSMALEFSDGKKYQKPLDKDYYLKAFLKNNCLRKSCYHCQYKGKERYMNIDIMLADWWGAESSELLTNSCDKGISAVFVNTALGEELWNRVSKDLNYQSISFENASTSNIAYNHAAVEGKNREAFMKNVNKISFDKLVNRYCRTPMINLIKKNAIKGLYWCAKKTGVLKIYKRLGK